MGIRFVITMKFILKMDQFIKFCQKNLHVFKYLCIFA